MPKILRIINRFNLGGPTYNVAYLTKYLAPEFETLLVGGMKDETEDSSEFIVRNLGIDTLIIPEMRREISLKNDWISYQKIKKLIEAYKPDIVHTHAAKAGAIGRLAAYNSKVPVIVHTFHGHVFHSYFGKIQTTFYKNIERYLAKKTSKIIAISEKQKEELSTAHKICGEKKIAVIPLGFDLSKFSENQEEKRKNFRGEYQISDDEIAIGIVGRLVPVKNHKLFLDAIKYLKENSTKKIRAFIIGDGELKEKIISEAKLSEIDISLGNERKSTLTFTSWIREIDVAYAGLDIVALTSFNEGTPVSLIEAQSAGKPVVSTKVGGIENVVRENISGFLSDLRESSKFFSDLKTLVENKELRSSFGNAGSEITNKFHYSVLMNNMRNCYYQLLQNYNPEL